MIFLIAQIFTLIPILEKKIVAQGQWAKKAQNLTEKMIFLS